MSTARVEFHQHYLWRNLVVQVRKAKQCFYTSFLVTSFPCNHFYQFRPLGSSVNNIVNQITDMLVTVFPFWFSEFFKTSLSQGRESSYRQEYKNKTKHKTKSSHHATPRFVFGSRSDTMGAGRIGAGSCWLQYDFEVASVSQMGLIFHANPAERVRTEANSFNSNKLQLKLLVRRRFNALLDAMAKGSPPDQRKSKRDPSAGCSDTRTPLHTSKGVSGKHEHASPESKASNETKNLQES